MSHAIADAPPPTLKVLGSIREVEASDWESLLDPDEPPFTRHAWLAAMEESRSAAPESGWTPHHLTLWQGERLVAACPAYVKAHSWGEYIYDFAWAQAAERAGLAYYPKLVLGAPLSPATTRRFLVARDVAAPAALRDLLARAAVAIARELGASGVHALFCTEEEARALEAAGFAHRVTLQFHWRNPGYAHLDDYLARFDAKRRHQLRREARAPAEQGLRLRTVRGQALTEEHAGAAHDFYLATCRRYPWGRVQLNRDFFQRVFATMPDQVELVEAVRGEHRIAGAFNLTAGGVLYGRYWGAHEEVPFLHFNVCMYHPIAEAIELGRTRFEPGAGGEHKVPRGFAPSAVHSAHLLFHPQLDAAVRDFIGREALHHRQLIADGESLAGLKPWGG